MDIALAETYARRTGNPVAAVSKMMEAETWLTGNEAKRLGFANELLGAVSIGARFDLSIYSKAPPAVAGTPTTKTEPIRRMRTSTAALSMMSRTTQPIAAMMSRFWGGQRNIVCMTTWRR